MKKVFFITTLFHCFIALSLLYPKAAIAQGTFSCAYLSDPTSSVPNTCILISSGCQPGYKPDDCNLWVASQEECQGVHQCVTQTPADIGCSRPDPFWGCPKGSVVCSGAVFCCPEAGDCDKIKEKQENTRTILLDIHGKCGKEAINTALGCVPAGKASAFIKWFLGRAILIAGGVAFLLMLSGSLMVIVSSGDQNKVKAGSELITSAIAGLIFIIFSLFLLRLIGIEILKIPGL